MSTNIGEVHYVDFYGVNGLADGRYYVIRHEVRKTVNLNGNLHDKEVWGRGVNSLGFSDENPNFGMGYCEVVSQSETSATLKTYIYQRYNGGPFDYYPTMPFLAGFKYSVLGYELPSTPTITMSGGIGDSPTLSFSGGGPAIDHYVLKIEYDFGSGFNTYSNSIVSSPYTDNNVIITRVPGDVVARYSVKSVDRLEHESEYSNTVSTDGQSTWKSLHNITDNEIINKYMLEDNYPNPFNPSTHINYQIPEDGFVSLVIYNALGEKVTTLVDQHQTSGKYRVKFVANNLPSGIYFCRLRSNGFNSIKKMILTK